MSSRHKCHARVWQVPVPPEMLMCLRHWRRVPRSIQKAVWREYRPGQEITKDPSAAYLEVMEQAIGAVAKWEGRAAPAEARPCDHVYTRKHLYQTHAYCEKCGRQRPNERER